MNVKHTAGPWSIIKDDEPNTIFFVMEEGCDVHPVAEVVYGWGCRDVDEGEANANLIAAAPDLLAALEDALRSCRKDFPLTEKGGHEFRAAYADHFKAIAKAKGE